MDNQSINPIQNMLMAMPALPDIIRGAMPVPLPQMDYEENPINMIFGNFKRGRLAKATEKEAEIAANSNRALTAKLDSINAIVTFSAKIDCQLAEFQHNKKMFQLEEEEKQMDIYLKQSQATQAGFEAKLAEMDYEIRRMKFEEMKGGK